jgi:hypothetical protein
MNRQLLILYICLSFFQVKAQSGQAKNAVFVEAGDMYQLNYSVNYNRIIYQYIHTKVSVNAGVSIEPVDKSSLIQPLFPVEISIFSGQRNHHFETAIILMPGLYYDYIPASPFSNPAEKRKVIYNKDFGTTAGLRVGYRYQRDSGGLFARISFTPTLFSSFVPFYDAKLKINKEDCALCFETQRSYSNFGLVPGITISLGKSF